MSDQPEKRAASDWSGTLITFVALTATISMIAYGFYGVDSHQAVAVGLGAALAAMLGTGIGSCLCVGVFGGFVLFGCIAALTVLGIAATLEGK